MHVIDNFCRPPPDAIITRQQKIGNEFFLFSFASMFARKIFFVSLGHERELSNSRRSILKGEKVLIHSLHFACIFSFVLARCICSYELFFSLLWHPSLSIAKALEAAVVVLEEARVESVVSPTVRMRKRRSRSRVAGGSRTSRGGSCTGDNCNENAGIIAGSVIGGIFGILAVVFTTVFCVKRCRGRPHHSNVDFIDQGSNGTASYEKDHFEAGPWSSRYYQRGRWHGPHTLSLEFDRGMSTVHGQGTDDVGDFTVEGIFSTKTHRMALTKKYSAGTGDTSENFGHSVTLQLVWNAANEQFEGKWFIQTAKYRGEDKFQLKAGSPTKIFSTNS